jgi:hypothetical protein
VGLGLLALTLTAVGFWVSRKKPAPAAVSGKSDPAIQTYDRKPAREPESKPKPAPIAGASQRPEEGPGEPWICPTCRVGYPAQQTTCPKDGTPLIPYAEFTERKKRAELEHAKRCPKCGKTYPQSAAFCGDDGSSLVEISAETVS